MIVCPWCGEEYEPAGDRRCPHCGTVPPPGEERAAPEPEPPPEAPTSADFPGPASLLDFLLGPEGLGLPWERRSEFGFWRGLGLTLKAVLLSPLAAFRAMRRTGALADPVIYALLVGTAAWALSGAMQACARGGLLHLLERLRPPAPGAPGGMGLPVRLAAALALAPFLALFLPAAAALTGHLCLRLFRVPGADLKLTFGVACYATASAAVLAVVPVCGGVIFFAWYVVAASAGVLVVHRSGLLPALGAVLLPPLAALCCCCALAGLFAVLAGAG